VSATWRDQQDITFAGIERWARSFGTTGSVPSAASAPPVRSARSVVRRWDREATTAAGRRTGTTRAR
jgi:hypothetical protein